MGDKIARDKIGRDVYYVRKGDVTVDNRVTQVPPDVDAAVAELRALIHRLQAAGVVTADGDAPDPQVLQAAVNAEAEQPGGLAALRGAVQAGATEAVKASVQERVGAWILMLVSAIGGA